MSLSLSSHAGFLTALEQARSVQLAAYCLAPPMLRALEAAADGGAHVQVRLEAQPYGGNAAKRAAINERTARALRAHGIDATLANDHGASHLKAAVLDGVAWLDDRNFPSTGPDLLVRDDDPRDVAQVHDAIQSRPVSSGRIAFTKSEALRLEADAIARCVGDVDIASESFSSSDVSVALRQHLAKGDSVRLIVGASEVRESKNQAAAVARLARLGADVRLAPSTNKLAVGDGAAWIGSANATFPTPDTAAMSEWGVETQCADGVAAIRAAFEDEWNALA